MAGLENYTLLTLKFPDAEDQCLCGFEGAEFEGVF